MVAPDYWGAGAETLKNTGASLQVLNKNKMTQALLLGKLVRPVFLGFPPDLAVRVGYLANATIGILPCTMSHYRADNVEISCWCHLSVLGGTQASLRGGLRWEFRV